MKERSIARTSVSLFMAAVLSVSTLTYASAEEELILSSADEAESAVICTEHSFDGGVITKKATVSAKGEVTYTCTECGFTKTEKTAKLTDISKAKLSGLKEKYTYGGKAVKPKVTLTYGGKTLKAGTDYKLTYKNNDRLGKATVTVTGKGSFGGTVSKTYIIIPAQATVKSVKSSSANKAVIKWKAQNNPSGYRVACSTTKSFKEGTVKYVTVSGTKTSATVKKLTGGKTYYFKVQAYKTVSGKKYYGKFSAVKKVKVKQSAAEIKAEKQQTVCDYGKAMNGGAYVYGGSSFRATDCSGLTMQCFAQIGISLPHSAAAQASYGKAVSVSNMEPGDLIIMCYGGHAGLYLGDGVFVHAANSYKGILIEPVSKLQYYHIDTVRRLI